MSEQYKNLKKPFFVLAPMDDVTDAVFRQVISETSSPDLFFTEFVNVDGLQSPGRQRLLPRLRMNKAELTGQTSRVVAQVWGKNPENYHKTVEQLVDKSLTKEANASNLTDDLDKKSVTNFIGADINMGCPDKTVVKNGCCSALINNRELASEVIKASQRAAGDHFPISVKCRVGFTTVDLSWIKFLLSHKLSMLTIHFRTTKEMSKVPAHWELAETIKQMRDDISPTTLLVGNGDVLSKKQGEDLAAKYGLDGIMIGRGVFGDPFIFGDNSLWVEHSKRQRIELYKRHVELFAKTWTDNERRVISLNKFCKIYIQGFAGAKEYREKLMGANSIDELIYTLDEALASSL